jgi:hypothetical protein
MAMEASSERHERTGEGSDMKERMLGMLTAFVLVVALAGAAFAGTAREVTAHGTGTMGSRWELDASDHGARLEIDFEVDSNRGGQAWRVLMTDNGRIFFDGVRRTQPDGEFDVERFIGDRRGSDRIVARATNRVTGEVCRGVVTI